MEERQNSILKKLDELKQTLMSMRGDLAKPTQQQPVAAAAAAQQVKAGSQQKIKKKPIDANNLAEIVINVHPKNVPYSLLALKAQWQGRLRLQADVYTHSSIPESEVTEAAKEFAKKLTKVDERQYITLNLTLIWKDVSTTEMVSSPSKLVPVYGEINILRFLNRIGPNEFHYEISNHEANLHDQVLDICYLLSKKHTDKECQKFVKQLGQRLGNSQFYNGSTSLSISDIAVSSILKKLFADNAKGLPANLVAWLSSISLIAGYF